MLRYPGGGGGLGPDPGQNRRVAAVLLVGIAVMKGLFTFMTWPGRRPVEDVLVSVVCLGFAFAVWQPRRW